MLGLARRGRCLQTGTLLFADDIHRVTTKNAFATLLCTPPPYNINLRLHFRCIYGYLASKTKRLMQFAKSGLITKLMLEECMPLCNF